MASLRSSFVVPVLLAGAAALGGCSSEADKLAQSEKAIAEACHKLADVSDDDALKCVSKTWNHAVLVSHLVERNTLTLPSVREACADKPLPEAKFQQGLIVGIKKDTAACFGAIDKSLNVAVQKDSEHYKEVSTQARYATERAHSLLPYNYQ